MDQICFGISRPLVTAIVKRGRAVPSSPTELNLLFHFYDGLGARVPRIVREEFSAPMQLGEATLQAVHAFPSVIWRQA